MKKYTAEIIVGVSVFVAIIVTAFSYLYFKEVPIRSERYTLDVLFDNVTGLEQNDPVLIAGVRVGRVKQIRLQGNKVLVRIDINRSVRLPVDTRAVIQSIGMVGEKFVELNPGASEQALVHGDTVVGVNPGDLSSLVPSLNALVREAHETLVELRSMVIATIDEQTRLNVRRGIQHTASIAEALDRSVEQNLDRLNVALANLTELSTELRALAAESRDDVEKTLAQLADGSARANRVLVQLDSSLTVVNGVLAHIENGESSLSKILYSDEMYARVDSITTEVEALLQDFKKRPQRYLDLNFIRIF